MSHRRGLPPEDRIESLATAIDVQHIPISSPSAVFSTTSCAPGSTATVLGAIPCSCPSTHSVAPDGVEVTCSDTAPAAARASARATLATRYMAPIVSATINPAAQCPRMRSSARSSDRLGGSNTMVNGSSTATSTDDRDALSLRPIPSREASREHRKASHRRRKASPRRHKNTQLATRSPSDCALVQNTRCGAASSVKDNLAPLRVCRVRCGTQTAAGSRSVKPARSRSYSCATSLPGFVSVGSVKLVGEVTQSFAQALLLGNERIAITPSSMEPNSACQRRSSAGSISVNSR